MEEVIGESKARLDGVQKSTGASKYLDDIEIPGMLHAKMVFAQRPHAIIRSVSFHRAYAASGVELIVTSNDVPGENRIGIVFDDQPLFADHKVRYEGDCIAVVGAHAPDQAQRASELVEVVYENLPQVTSVEEAEKPVSPPIHEGGNIALVRNLTKGDIEAGRKQSEIIIKETFHFPPQEHAYMETLGCLVIPNGDQSVEVLVPAQCPFYVREAVARCLGTPLSKVRVVQLPIGGGFGGKEDVPSEISARAAVLAIRAQRPVKLVLSREEDILYSSKRHPMIITVEMGCRKDGSLTFANIHIKADVGAYATLSPIVLYRSTVHAAGPYTIPHVRVRTVGYYTNTAPKGAMRGFGTPQVTFACESVIDEIAERLGLDPIELRLRNALKEACETATGQKLGRDTGFVETLEKAREFLKREGKTKEQESSGRKVRGFGVASMFYGMSLGAIGRLLDRGGARVELLKDGSVNIYIGCTEMGQGALTVIAQIASRALGVSLDRISVHNVDTDVVPDSGPTVASRTTVISGNAVLDAITKIITRMTRAAEEALGGKLDYNPRQQLFKSEDGKRSMSLREVIAHCYRQRIDLSSTGWYVAPDCRIQDETTQGKAYYTYCFATHVAAIEVDTETGEVGVRSYFAAHDSGRIINPMLAAGQVEGGIAQGIGLALTERLHISESMIESKDFSTYLIPTALDICDSIHVEFIEKYSEEGPFGAKGLGEPAIIPVPAAIANAVSRALRVRVKRLPVDREWVIEVCRREPELA